MAKKGQAVQLQAEINTDEEWERLLHREGLIVVDVYSNWCGPCLGMSANLKKLKLEIGGDMLHLAMAKSDNIQALERFRNKSEPTWMFISKGKMVNFMFGANSPKLTRLIIDELKKETAAVEGTRERSGWNITEMADEERERYDVQETLTRAAVEKEEAKRTKEIFERRTAECENIITNLPNFGTVLIFPHAVTKYKEILVDVIEEAGLLIQQTEKVTINEKMLEELEYFAKDFQKIPEEDVEAILSDECTVILLKPAARGEQLEDVCSTILRMVYGESKAPPGGENSPARRMFEAADLLENKFNRNGFWVPPNDCVRAASLKLFFNKFTYIYSIPEPEPEPPYVTIVFDATDTDKAHPIMEQYPNQIMHYGFFTSEVPEETQLVAKSIKKYNKLGLSRTFTEKLVIQVSKKKSECVFAFAQLGPRYMSPNPQEGKRECEYFFPDDYEEVPPEEEEVIEEEEVQAVQVRIASIASVPKQQELEETEIVQEGQEVAATGDQPTEEVAKDEELVEIPGVEEFVFEAVVSAPLLDQPPQDIAVAKRSQMSEKVPSIVSRPSKEVPTVSARTISVTETPVPQSIPETPVETPEPVPPTPVEVVVTPEPPPPPEPVAVVETPAAPEAPAAPEEPVAPVEEPATPVEEPPPPAIPAEEAAPSTAE